MTNRPEGENSVPPQDTAAVPPDEPTEIRNHLRSASEAFNLELVKWREVQPSLEQRPDIKKLIDSVPEFLKIGKVLTYNLEKNRQNKGDLWEWGLRNGFSQNCFHDLFLVETLLTKYDSNDPNWRQIAEVIQNMAKIIKDLLAYVEAKIDECKIFTQLPPEGSKLEQMLNPYAATKIPEIKSAVIDHAKTGDTGFVIAYRYVGIVYKDERLSKSQAWTYNPSEWM